MAIALVVSHEASRTGAPRVAAEVLRALRKDGWQAECVLRWDGPLRAELSHASSRLWMEPGRRLRAALRRYPRLRPLALRVESLAALAVLLLRRPRVVHLNTVLSACYVRPALRLGIPVVLHVHELEPLASQVLRRYRIRHLSDGMRVVACSTAVRDNLARVLDCPPADIDVVPSVPDGDRVRSLAGSCPEPGGPIVVAACGTADHRKGVDLFLAAAERVASARGDGVEFRWIGADGPERPMMVPAPLLHGDRLSFIAASDNPYRHLVRCDVFVLTSRVDPFPLVVLEAMALGRPVVAFDVGGVAEQLGNAGILVPAGDVTALSAAVVRLCDDAEERERLRQAGVARVRSAYSIEQFQRAIALTVRAAATATSEPR